MSDFRFHRALRLSDKTAINNVFRLGKKIHSRYLSIFFYPNQLDHPRFCPSISKKYIPKAHDRIQIKRILRESFRLHQHKLLGFDIVVVVYKSLATLDKKQIRHILDQRWIKLT